MKSKKILKFLVTSILVATVTTSNVLIFAKKEKIKTVEVAENPKNVIKVKSEEIPKEVTKKDVIEKVKKVSKNSIKKEIYTKEEINKEIKEENKNFSENRKIETKNENDFSKKIQEIFKNFKKEDYEIKGFKLTVYFKNGVPILFYEHIKTKAKIVIIPINNLNLTDADPMLVLDKYTFKAFKPDDRGLVHYLEHCIASNMLKIALQKNIELNQFNAYTFKDSLEIVYDFRHVDDSFIESLMQELKSPTMLKDKNIFKIEKSRILNEAENKKQKMIVDELLQRHNYGKFIYGGVPEKLKDINDAEVKKYYEEIIHPSNLLVIKHLNLTPSNVEKYLGILNKEYLEHYDYKEISVEPFRKKENYNYKKFETCKKQNVIYYTNIMKENINYDYRAEINFLDSEKQKEKELYHKYAILNYRIEMSIKEKLELEKFIKNLGYLDVSITSLNKIVLYGDDEKLFEKEKLIENYNKILNYIVEKFKNFSDKEIEENFSFLKPLNYNKDGDFLNLQQEFFSNPIKIKKTYPLFQQLIENFIDFNEPFSEKTLKITENNEIKDSKEYYINKIKKDILNLKELKNKTPSKIEVWFRSKSKEKDPEYLKALENINKKYLVPLKFKGTKNNVLLHLVKTFLINKLSEEVHSRALNYYPPTTSPFIKGYIAFNEAPNEKIFNKELKFIKEDFEKFLKNLKINKAIFNKLKEDCNKIIKDGKDEVKRLKKEFNKALRAVNYYLKHGLDENADVYNEKKGGFKIDSKTTRSDLYNKISLFYSTYPVIHVFSNFKEYLNYKKLESEFILKYGHPQNSKHKDVLIDKEFVKDLKKHIIEPLEKAILNKEKFDKEIKNGLDSVPYGDFVKTLKSCSLVKKETYEKDQKKLDEILRKSLDYYMF